MAKNAVVRAVMNAIEKRAMVLVDSGTAAGNAIADATEEVLGLPHHKRRLSKVSTQKKSKAKTARKNRRVRRSVVR